MICPEYVETHSYSCGKAMARQMAPLQVRHGQRMMEMVEMLLVRR